MGSQNLFQKVDELMCAGAGVLQGLVAPTARGYHGLGTTGVSSHISLGQVPHCNQNSIYVLLFGELRGLSPNVHIHVSV